MIQNIRIFKSQNLVRLNELTKKKCLRRVLCMSYRYLSLFGERHSKFNLFAFHRNGMGSILVWCLSSNLTLLNSANVAKIAKF